MNEIDAKDRLIEELKADLKRCRTERSKLTRERDAAKSALAIVHATTKLNESTYQEGVDTGRRATIKFHDDYINPIQTSINQVNGVMCMMRGAALAGAGELQREPIHHLSGELVRWLELTKQRIQRAAIELKNPEFSTAFDVSPAYEVLKAADHFYATGDVSGLCALPNENSPIMVDLYVLRGELSTGRKPEKAIDLLVEWAWQLKRETSRTWARIAEMITSDLKRKEALSPVEEDVLKLLNVESPGEYLRRVANKPRRKPSQNLLRQT